MDYFDHCVGRLACPRVDRLQVVSERQDAGRQGGQRESYKPFWMDAEYEAGLIAGACSVCGGLDMEAVRWKTPLSAVTFFVAVAAKRSGNKLVGRRGSSQKIMERLESMMDTRLAELGEANAGTQS